MSEQKKYLFIEVGSSYPYVSSNSEDVWNFIRASNILTGQYYNECPVNNTTFIDLEKYYDNPSITDLFNHIHNNIEPVLKMLDCDIVWIKDVIMIGEFESKVREHTLNDN